MYRTDFELEGSCNYAAKLVLSQYHDPYAEFQIYNMAQANDAVYGDGYRKMIAYTEKYGLRRWLSMLRGN